ncbi:hypothetical protein [Algoriphagus halophytocola]|uniref:DUF5723 domain-containing protein n=1 Tax=Algoriphagus halophytocola TaxID=2991499 RepID=A0ABY6MJ74_9BACT|nr:hypothetical protein [Algoriphagus sp. TR-M5]UZD23688.1 hypothetical protein OM944_04160 [Algoriphagus sp. TR-M5]
MPLFKRINFLIFFILISVSASAQKLLTKRSTFYTVIGTSGAKLNQIDDMLADRGLSGLRNRYNTLGLGYQARINDFVLGLELLHNRGAVSEFDQFRINYRTSRAMLNIGYALTEESNFQLIHYMSMGVGYLNFQMMPKEQPDNLQEFLTSPEEGFILREQDIQKGSQHYGNFLTEIGFQLTYDFDLPGRPEALQIISQLGYSFSPIEGNWEMAGVAFDNTQSGAFIRVGAGITLPDRNFFYKDAGIGISLIRGIHFTHAEKFNAYLEEADLEPLNGMPSNWGLKITGETKGLLYGAELYNLALSGDANSTKKHSLNSLRVYANMGYKPIQYRNFGIGALAGLGYGNIRYTNLSTDKPDFAELFEQRYFDGYLKNSGLMLKPEVFVEYGLPMTKRKFFDLVFTAAAGYELPLGRYRLAEVDMASYISAPYLSFGIGVRP